MHEKEEGCRMFLFMVKEENICSSFPTVKYRNIWCSRSYHEDHEVLPWMVSWSLICRSSSNYELAFPWLRFQEVIGLRPCSLFLGMHEAKTFCMPRRTGRTRGFSIPAGSFLVTIRFILEIVLYILQKNNYSSVGVLASITSLCN